MRFAKIFCATRIQIPRCVLIFAAFCGMILLKRGVIVIKFRLKVLLAMNDMNQKQLAEQTGISIGALLGILVSIVGVALVISVLWNVFLIAPIGVGIDRFFVLNANGKPGFGELPYAFKKGRYLKSVGALFLSGLFIVLWSFLLVIPGIIKLYEYRMVSYILADDSDLSVMECLRRSKEMMRGHKWNAFVLDLSFIGWHLLAGVTCGVLGIFYVYPYVQATDAELYLALKNEM